MSKIVKVMPDKAFVNPPREIIPTDNPEYAIEIDNSGWQERYRLIHEGEKTQWTMYERPLMLNGMVAVSPYYTDADTWVIRSPLAACQMLCAVRDPKAD